MKSKRLMYNKYAREAFKFHDASIKEAVDKVLANSHVSKKSNRFKKEEHISQPEEADVVWSRRKSTQRQSNYLTPTGAQHLSPQQTSSVKIKRRDFNKPRNQLFSQASNSDRFPFKFSDNGDSSREFDDVLGFPRTAKIYTGKFKFLTTPRGIPNVGLSCYINSPLQCLLTLPGLLEQPIPRFLDPYMQILYNENLDANQLYQKACQGRTETNVCFSLQLEQEEKLLAAKTGTLGKIKKSDPSAPQQEDAHDFLIRLLGLWDVVEIKNLFKFKMRKTLKCHTCNHERELPQESYYELSVAPNKSIKLAISQSTHELQEIECNCGIGVCNGKTMTRSAIPADGPSYLLLRTEIFDPYPPWNKKPIQKNIPQFSETIEFKTQAGTVNYKVHGFVVHSGNSRDNGHYVSYIRKEKEWLKYSDDTLIKIHSLLCR